MDKKSNISMTVIKRLPKYYRYLGELIQNDIDRISSKELSEKIGFTASQIRQDLNNFGEFGQQGYGYNVKQLYNEIGQILGLTRKYNIIIIGAGNIGQAIANYSGFKRLGFSIQAIFDINPKVIGLKINDVEVMDIELLDKFLKENVIDIAVICVPKNGAQEVFSILDNNNVKGVWNFAPVDLKLKKGSNVVVQNVHLSESLLTLSCLISGKMKQKCENVN